ncbi:MAG: helix-turn-helix domain-containing protein, partial [Treponema sp.]|nr:helix-turn-helix domain-containing protein [Treponema sp.]
MDAEKTGNLINFLRTKMGITQKELAAKINVSDKAVSKWERGDGCPDVGILPVLAQNLECDVDSLIRGELPSTTPRKELTEEEVQALLAASGGEEMKKDLSLLKNPGPRIKIYDFKRPDLFNKFQLRKIANIFEMLCEKVAMELIGNRKDLLGLKLVSVDQLTNEEFIRSLPERTFFYSYDYENSGFALEI